MKRFPFIVAALVAIARADQEAPNVPRVFVADGGRCYAKSVPKSRYGNDGETRIFNVNEGEDVLAETLGRYSQELYLNCGLGKGNKWGLSVVQMGAWPRGHEPDKETLALAFWFGGALVKSYSTLDLAGAKGNFESSVSHYRVIDKALGYRWIDSNEYEFEIRMVDGTVVSFDPTDGRIVSRKGGTEGKGGTGTNRAP